MSIKKFKKQKTIQLFSAIFFLILFFCVNIQLCQAKTCLEKYPDTIGHCEYQCGDGETPDPDNTLCNGLICCPGVQKPTGTIEPNEIELNIPIFTFTKVSGMAQYILTIYSSALYIIVPLLIIVVMYGGMLWMSSGFNESQKKKAISQIIQGFIGLGIVIFSYVLLSIVGIKELKEPTIEYIAAQKIEEFKLIDLEEAVPTDNSEISGGTIGSQGQACYYSTFGNSSSVVQSKLVSVPCPGLNGTLKVHQLAADAYKQACSKIPTGQKLTCGKNVSINGTFNWRMVNTGHGPSATNRSFHSFGIALDISPWECGACDNASRSKCNCKPNIPTAVINAFKSTPGFRWGGDYKSKCDNMHFEWLGPCAK